MSMNTVILLEIASLGFCSFHHGLENDFKLYCLEPQQMKLLNSWDALKAVSCYASMKRTTFILMALISLIAMPLLSET